MFQQHPELHHRMAPIVACAARRLDVSESSLRALQSETARTTEERELFARLRGVARDSAVPTCVVLS